ncbi:Uncharacterised protein [Bifidobacterium pseudocatenulatum]|nr:Uncharacterised protein [Bifidobacterium pseudocatenulatum]
MRFFHRACAFEKNLMMSWMALESTKVYQAFFIVPVAEWTVRPAFWTVSAIVWPAAKSVLAAVCAAFLQALTAWFEIRSVE